MAYAKSFYVPNKKLLIDLLNTSLIIFSESEEFEYFDNILQRNSFSENDFAFKNTYHFTVSCILYLLHVIHLFKAKNYQTRYGAAFPLISENPLLILNIAKIFVQ